MGWRICILITQTPKDKFRKYICSAVAKKERNWFYIQIFIGNACSSDAAYLQQGKIKIACDVKSAVKTECVYVCRSVVQIAARHRGQISNQKQEEVVHIFPCKKKIYRFYLLKSQRLVPIELYFLLKDCQFRQIQQSGFQSRISLLFSLFLQCSSILQYISLFGLNSELLIQFDEVYKPTRLIDCMNPQDAGNAVSMT